MKLGQFDLHLISDGYFRLDGGAMFGVVPKVLWNRTTECDEQNRIRLALNCLLLQTGEHNLLIDTGCGHKYTEKQMRIYGIEHPTDILSQLASRGLDPADIDIVINTHLHFDHCGGNTLVRADEVIPTFPEATYMVRRQEFEEASHPDERTAATYLHHNWLPVQAEGRLELVEEDSEIVPGVTVMATPGHTLGHQSVRIESDGRVLFCIGDLCPTQAHVPLPWIMAFDVYPMKTLESRRRIYRRAVDENWNVFFGHDSEHPLGNLIEEEGGYKVRPLPWGDAPEKVEL